MTEYFIPKKIETGAYQRNTTAQFLFNSSQIPAMIRGFDPINSIVTCAFFELIAIEFSVEIKGYLAIIWSF